MSNEINAYFGKYLGLSPTDESKAGVGEIEVKVGEDGIRTRHATGLRVDEQVIPLERVRGLTDEEVRARYVAGPEEYAKIDAFRIGEEGPVLLFLREPNDDEPRLVVRLGKMDQNGPTMLFDEEQVKNGEFDYVINELTQQVGQYPFPRLQYGGLHEPRG